MLKPGNFTFNLKKYIFQNGRMITYGGVIEIDTVRTSDVYGVWLKLPTLKELCWDYITQMVPHLGEIEPLKLFESGIPMDLIERLR